MAFTQRGKGRGRSTPWSEFAWDESRHTWYASRPGPSGDIEYDYREPEQTEEAKIESQKSRSSIFVPEQDYPQASYQPDPEFASFENDSSVANPTGSNSDLPAANYKGSDQGNTGGGYQTATTRSYIPTSDEFTSSPGVFRFTESRWNPSPSGFASYPTGTSGGYERQPGVTQIPTFYNNDPLTASFDGLSFSPPTVAETEQPVGVGFIKFIVREPNSPNFEEIDPRFQVVEEKRQRKFWKVGRVFMMLWTEFSKVPPGGGTRNGSHFSTVWLSESAYSEMRKFVVIREGHGNCICSPIQTYSGQATLKLNLPNPQEHAIIYTSKRPPEEYYEEVDGIIVRENLFKDPIKVKREQTEPEGDLGELSRLNYSKFYSVDHNVRVLNIGIVTEESLPSLMANSSLGSSTKPRVGSSKSKATRTAADERKKKSKQGGGRSTPSGSRAQGEPFAEGGRVKTPTQGSDHDPNVLDLLDEGYEVIREPSRFFKKGRVIKVLWTEPAGNVSESEDSFVIPSRFGEKAFAKIRRFVVVREMQDCCWCLMLNTHHSKGASKAGVNPDNYAAVFPLGGTFQLGPDENLTKEPFPIKVEVSGESISPKSRLNFGRIYTLEHNIRVKKVGRIPDQYLQQLDDYFSQTSAGK